MIQSLYEEIVVRSEEFVSVRLTPEAYARGLAVALPQEVVVPAPPSRGGCPHPISATSRCGTVRCPTSCSTLAMADAGT
jgi:hypothetical protein